MTAVISEAESASSEKGSSSMKDMASASFSKGSNSSEVNGEENGNLEGISTAS